MHPQPHDWNSQTSQPYSGAPYSAHSTAPAMNAYSSYAQPSGTAHGYGSSSHSAYTYAPQMLSPQSATHAPPMSSQLLPLGGMHATSTHYNQPSTPSYSQAPHSQISDSTGQVAPPGIKPKVTATLWEDEGTICFQVECNGLCVARREDNQFINGTKLLNVAGMTRGRRDGILKSEKTRMVVKIGPMHLKGVWIPYERALDFANREKITEKLYPLFVHNIGQLIPQNQARSQALTRPKVPPGGMGPIGSIVPSLPHHPSMQLPSQVASSQRPGIDRAHTFPTPPASASSVINSGSEYWSSSSLNNGLQNNQPLNIDTGMSTARSMPSTPASTPPANSLQSVSSFGHQSLNSAAQPSTQYGSSYGNGNYNMKSEMAPPSRSGTLSGAESKDIKQDPFSNGTSAHDGSSQDQSSSYSQDGGAFNPSSQSSYHFGGVSGLPAMTSMQPDGPDHAGVTQHDSNGQLTPRTSVGHDQWTGYQTPPRTNAYANPTYPSSIINGANKRSRDDDEGDFKLNGNIDSLKRRRSTRDELLGQRGSMMPVAR